MDLQKDLDRLTKIKKLTIIALFSDDDLMDRLVLKGGNAIDLLYDISLRGSVDLDFSIPDDFTQEELVSIKERIEALLQRAFREEDYEVFDVKFLEKPHTARSTVRDPEIAAFWGGYLIEFKVIESSKYDRLKDLADKNNLRRQAMVLGPDNSKKFYIDISKYEYCAPKQQIELDGYNIYCYPPVLIVCEKLRAICQQMDEYKSIIKTATRSPRARDFFDIYIVIEHFKIDLNTEDNKELLKNVFAVKKVPLQFIELIPNYRAYHSDGFKSVLDTVKQGKKTEDFDFYFDYVLNKIEPLKTLWKE